MAEDLGGCLFIAFFFVVGMVVSFFIADYSCETKFAGSNLESDYSILTGCRVKTPDQGWIPAENYRVL